MADPTHGKRILDVIFTNAHKHYDRATVGPPIGPDVAGVGTASDHAVAVARPVVDRGSRRGISRYTVRKRRVVTAGTLLSLGICLAVFDWKLLYDANGIDAKVDYFNHSINEVIDKYCPEKSTGVRLNGKFYVSAKCTELSNEKNKEYRLHKNSPRFKQLRSELKKEIKESNKKKIDVEVTKANCTYK